MRPLTCLLLLACAGILSGCASIDYIGKSYPPTERVDLFFDESEIPREYEVMGKVIASTPQGSGMDKFQSKLVAAAKAKGADALLIERFDRVKTGETRQVSRSAGDRRWDDATVTTDYDEDIQIRARFLKYMAPGQ